MPGIRFIVRNKKILGGEPVIIGTRVPVERVIFLLEKGYTEENLHAEFPHVPVKKIKGTVAELAIIGFSQL